MNKTRENEDLLRMLRLETDLGRYQTFVVNTGKVKKKKIEIFQFEFVCFSLYSHYLMNNKQVILNRNRNDQKKMMKKMECNENLI